MLIIVVNWAKFSFIKNLRKNYEEYETKTMGLSKILILETQGKNIIIYR